MAATVEICESNGASETITHNITNTNMGSTDAANLVAASYPLDPGNRSYTKYQRFHVTAMGGSSAVNNLKIWVSAGSYSGSDTHVTNARESSYGGAATYAQPVTTAVSGVDQTFPTAEPSGANVGIGGSLTGELTGTGYSDYFIHQLNIHSGTTTGATLTVSFQYDEVQ